MSNYKFSDFRFDSENHILLQGSEKYCLREKTGLLLKLLIENREQILSKQAILDKVWPDRHVGESVIYDSVKELRGVLKDSATSSKFIATFPKKGYQWVYKDTVDSSNHNLENSSFKVKLRPIHSVAIALILVISVLFVLFSPANNEATQTQANISPRLRILVFPVVNNTKDPAYAWIEQGLMNALNQTFKLHDNLDVIDSNTFIEFVGSDLSKVSLLTHDKLKYLTNKMKFDYSIFVQVYKKGQRLSADVTLYQANRAYSTKVKFESVQIGELTQKIHKNLADLFSKIRRENNVPEALALNSDSMEIYMRANNALNLRNYEKSKSLFQTLLEKDPTLIAAKEKLASIAVLQREYQLAADLTEEVLIEAKSRDELLLAARANVRLAKMKSYQPPYNSNEVIEMLERSIIVFTELNSLSSLAYAHIVLSREYQKQLDYEAAHKSLNKALDYYTQDSYTRGVGWTLQFLGENFNRQRLFEQAELYFERSISVRLKIGDYMGIAKTHRLLGDIAFRHSEEKALAHYLESLSIYNQIGNDFERLVGLRKLGGFWNTSNRPKAAHDVYQKIVSIAEKSEHPKVKVDAYSVLARYHFDNKELSEKFRKRAELIKEDHSKRNQGYVL